MTWHLTHDGIHPPQSWKPTQFRLEAQELGAEEGLRADGDELTEDREAEVDDQSIHSVTGVQGGVGGVGGGGGGVGRRGVSAAGGAAGIADDVGGEEVGAGALVVREPPQEQVCGHDGGWMACTDRSNAGSDRRCTHFTWCFLMRLLNFSGAKDVREKHMDSEFRQFTLRFPIESHCQYFCRLLMTACTRNRAMLDPAWIVTGSCRRSLGHRGR